MASTRRITVDVNGRRHETEIESRLHLGDLLRNVLGLTGTHLGCEHGACGACTVLVDGEAVRSCLMLAAQADGAEVTTVEGLAADDGTLSPLQEAFSAHHALQCGFCTPGVLTSLTAFLRDNPDPSERDVREALSGNICRCTGYQPIVDAALDAARAVRSEQGNANDGC